MNRLLLTKVIITIFILSIHYNGNAQTESDIPGTWKGPSLCQVKNSPCHDESAVYHVTKSDHPGKFSFLMNKMVNGKEEEMGTLEFTYDAGKHQLSCVNPTNNSLWVFTIKDAAMHGTLTWKNTLYRIIDLKKEK